LNHGLEEGIRGTIYTVALRGCYDIIRDGWTGELKGMLKHGVEIIPLPLFSTIGEGRKWKKKDWKVFDFPVSFVLNVICRETYEETGDPARLPA
jgi:hypothetical protein